MMPRATASLNRRAARTCSCTSRPSRWTASRRSLKGRWWSSRYRLATKGCTPRTWFASSRPPRHSVSPPPARSSGGVFVSPELPRPRYSSPHADALSGRRVRPHLPRLLRDDRASPHHAPRREHVRGVGGDRKSTRLNSSHSQISYAVFCLKKKKQKYQSHRSPSHCAFSLRTTPDTSSTNCDSS